MTDKPIMIDGVDISGCEFYWREKELCNNGNLTSDCQENKDCLYKKYKHKEQEVQQAMDNYVQLDLQRVKEYNELINLYKAKEQECEKLKEDRERWKSNFNGKVSAIEELLQQLDQLKQTLAEIKEIAEVEIECKTYEIENDCFNETRCKALNEHIDFLKQILQKISEVGECKP